MFSRFPGTRRSAFSGVCSDSGLKSAFCPQRIVRWVSVRFLREDVFWLSAAFYSTNAKPDILPARPDSIGKWPPGNKEKNEQLLLTDFCSKLWKVAMKLSWEGLLGLIIDRPIVKETFSFSRSCWLHYNNGLLWSFNAIAFALISVRTLQIDKDAIIQRLHVARLDKAIEWASWRVGGWVSEWVGWVCEWVTEWANERASEEGRVGVNERASEEGRVWVDERAKEEGKGGRERGTKWMSEWLSERKGRWDTFWLSVFPVRCGLPAPQKLGKFSRSPLAHWVP